MKRHKPRGLQVMRDDLTDSRWYYQCVNDIHRCMEVMLGWNDFLRHRW